MKPGSPDYDDVVTTYIRVIKRDSTEAAAALEKIRSVCGARAALRATLVVTLLKIEKQKGHGIADIHVHNYLIKDYPPAQPLLEYALRCCLLAWGTPYGEADLSEDQAAEADEFDTGTD